MTRKNVQVKVLENKKRLVEEMFSPKVIEIWNTFPEEVVEADTSHNIEE